MATDTTNTLSATDRKQLCKITNGRFEMLREQLQSRRNEINAVIRSKVMDDHQSDIVKIRKELAAVEKQREKNEEEYNRKEKQLDHKRSEIENKASDLGLKISTSYTNKIGSVEPKNVNKVVEDRSKEIAKQHAAANINLRTKELEVLEEISVAGLKSDEAKDFLGKIPDIDNLLPAPENIKELQA